MTLRVRVPVPPEQVRAIWATSLASGLLLIGLGPVPRASLPDGLVPPTVTRYLAEMLPEDAQHVRLNNLYGSGHSGAWQFKAHVTWRDRSGAIHGGATNLPQLAGADPVDLEFDNVKLEREEQIGWTLNEAAALLRRLPGTGSRLAMVEMVPDPGHPAAVITCAVDGGPEASCEDMNRSGRRIRKYSSQLVDQPLLGPLAVQRTLPA